MATQPLQISVHGATDGSGITVSTSDLMLVADVDDSNNVKKIPLNKFPAAGSAQTLQYNNSGVNGGISDITWDGNNLKIADDTKLIFGTNSDAAIEYDEDGDNYLMISGSTQGIFLHGNTIQIDGTLAGASPLRIEGAVEFQSDSFLGFGGVTGRNITHCLTLPNLDTPAGKIKANAFVSYSSIRYKKEVEALEKPMSVINELDGVSFKWKDTDKLDYGFIAEDVGKVLPNIVEWEENGVDATSLDYTKIISFPCRGCQGTK